MCRDLFWEGVFFGILFYYIFFRFKTVAQFYVEKQLFKTIKLQIYLYIIDIYIYINKQTY